MKLSKLSDRQLRRLIRNADVRFGDMIDYYKYWKLLDKQKTEFFAVSIALEKILKDMEREANQKKDRRLLEIIRDIRKSVYKVDERAGELSSEIDSLKDMRRYGSGM